MRIELHASAFDAQADDLAIRVAFADSATDPHRYVIVEWDSEDNCSYLEINDQLHSAMNAISGIDVDKQCVAMHVRPEKLDLLPTGGTVEIRSKLASGELPQEAVDLLRAIKACIGS
jgi:hypothetical protein